MISLNSQFFSHLPNPASAESQSLPQPPFLTLVELLRHRSRDQAQDCAFRFLQDGEVEQGSVSYQELDQQAQRIAAHLQTLTRPGDRALLLYPSGLEFIAAFFGCLYANVIAVPAYPPRANQNLLRLQAIVGDCEAAITLTTAALLPNLQARWQNAPDRPAHQWLATDALTATPPNPNGSRWQEPAISSDSLAFLQYTSGSTGQPKGVMVSHGNLLHNEQMIQQAFGHGSHTVSVGWLPLFHDMGLVGNILQPLYLGLPCTLMTPVDFLQKPIRWLQAISRYRATSSGGPNFAYDLCLRKITPEQRRSLDLSSWEVAFSGAEPVRAETLDQFAAVFADCGFRKSAFYPCYGMAEATLFITGGAKSQVPTILTVDSAALTQNRVIPIASPSIASQSSDPLVVGSRIAETEIVDAPIADTPIAETQAIVSCGHRWGDQRLRIVNPETFMPCSEGRVGEIWVAGQSVTQGYWNRPDLTEQIFQAQIVGETEPFLRTGDLGFLQNGELFVTGRLKDLIVIRGRNHYPQDLEATVEQAHVCIRQPSAVAAFSIEVDNAERLVVVAEMERAYWRQKDLDRESVFQAIRGAIAQHHELQIHAIQLLKPGSLPKTSSGKIQRHACRTGFIHDALEVIHEWREASSQVNLPIDSLGNSPVNSPGNSPGNSPVNSPANSPGNSPVNSPGNSPTDPQAVSHAASNSTSSTSSTNSTNSTSSTNSGSPGLTNGATIAMPAIDRVTLLSQSLTEQHQTVQAWLVAQVSSHLKVNPHSVSLTEPLTQYGLDSVEAISIVAELEDWLERRFSLELVYDYPTIEALSQVVVEQLHQQIVVPVDELLDSHRSDWQPAANLFWDYGRKMYRRWFQLHCQGLEHLPQNQPYILAANHTSHLDLGAIITALGSHVDQVASLGAKDYFFDRRLKSWFFRNFLNLIPLDREGEFAEAIETLRACQQVLDTRKPIVIFPEGSRSRTGELQPFQPGVGLLALWLNVPIVPVYIDGTYQALPKGRKIPRPHPIRVTFGQPIVQFVSSTQERTVTDREQCQMISEQVRTHIIQLRATHYDFDQKLEAYR